MRIFLYEFVTGGGWRSADGQSPPPGSLAREGEAMIAALATDFLAMESVTITTLRDTACPLANDSPLTAPRCRLSHVGSADEELNLLARFAAEADWTVLIAPEFDAHLETRARLVESAGGRLLGPRPQLIALAADKQRFAEHLARREVPAPRGRVVVPDEAPPSDLEYPTVWKPQDGCGSQGIRLARSPSETPTDRKVPYRVEPFCPGVAASVAFLCGRGGCVALQPCRQVLSDDGAFRYLGGELPLPPELADRATRIARKAVATLDDPLGYLGIDLILGPDARGKDDVIMELNPRLTTSYVGLRRAAQANLAQAMLEVAVSGETTLRFRQSPVRFDSNGEVRP